ncbi:MAG: SH3 domain-containing protein [Acidobacteriaceae bacterium]
MLFALLALQGCSHLRPQSVHEYVYVWAPETYLRDRVAVVSNRVAEVTNGERLQVLEHGRRFLKVKTGRNEIGWIEDHFVIDQATYDKFGQMTKDNADDPVVGTAILREDYWLRDAPGRTSDRFYLVPENAKLQLLLRASVPKPVPPPHPVPLPPPTRTGARPVDDKTQPSPPPDLEDYWLVRDNAGHVGWIRGRTLDEDVPDAVAGLAEGQKILGAYVLTRVDDPGANVPGNQVPEYVVAMSPWKDGLPYDFDQIRVFTWNTRKHRYETAYREREIAGYLPVTIGRQTFDNHPEPVFSFRVASGDQPALDLQTGLVRPGSTVTESYRMEGVLVHRIGAAPPPSTLAKAPRHSERGHRGKRG